MENIAYEVWTEEMDRGNFNLDAVRLVDPVVVEAEMAKRLHQGRLRYGEVAERFRAALLWEAPRWPKCFRSFR